MALVTRTFAIGGSTDAAFRAYVQAVTEMIAGVGLVNTNATGSIDPTTTTNPTAFGQVRGYQVWRFDDALQATAPVFVKLEYGGVAVQSTLYGYGIWATIGTAHDGAGNLTGSQVAARTVLAFQSGVTATAYPSFASGANNRLVLVLASNQNQYLGLLTVERAHDSTGADTSAAISVATASYNNNAPQWTQQYVPCSSTGAPTAETQICCALSRNNPTAFGGRVGVGVMLPLWGSIDNPSRLLACYQQNDFPTHGQALTVPIYGSAHLMYCLTSGLSNPTNGSQATTRVMVRYE